MNEDEGDDSLIKSDHAIKVVVLYIDPLFPGRCFQSGVYLDDEASYETIRGAFDKSVAAVMKRLPE